MSNKQATPSPHNKAILIAGHGSRDMDAVTEFHRLADHLRAAYPDRLCETGFLEFARPLISDGLDKLIAAGAKDIIAAPGMLMAARHAKNDIPSEINAIQAEHKEVTIQYGVELGVHAKMLQAAQARIEEAEAKLGNDYRRQDTLLLVVGRGATDSDANSNISKITRMLWEGMDFGWAETCYSGVVYPLVDEGFKHAAKLGYKNILVFPYFLFTGRLVKMIYDKTDAFAAAHPDTRVIKAPYLSDHPKVIEAFIDRIDAVENGTGNMNCQMCKYREQIIGFESDVGEAQEGHHHHVRGIGTDHVHDHHHHSHGDKD